MRDGCFQIALGRGVVLLRLGNAGLQIERASGIDRLQLRDQSLSAAETSADDGGSAHIVFAQISEGLCVSGIQLNRQRPGGRV